MSWPISPAIHLVRTRGRKGLALYVGCALLAAVISMACRALGSLLL